ncbi:MAG: preprotein translocase subunit SecG [Phenylobacterium sp.]|nr:preprotein translocase subunit SecG [Phenylobacterium sp.]MDP3855744.1 preprotein translocase subunit SecG [Phenylobacterium sp.]
MLLGILLTIHIIVCISLIGVVLLQRSEGGALGMGGGPTGFMSARGAGDLLTRITWILGTVFFVLSLALTLLAGSERGASSVVDNLKIDAIDPNSLNRPAAPAPTQPATAAPTPLTAPTPQVRNPFAGEQPAAPAPAPAPSNP